MNRGKSIQSHKIKKLWQYLQTTPLPPRGKKQDNMPNMLTVTLFHKPQFLRENVRSSFGVASVKLSLMPPKNASLVCPGARATL